MSKENYPNDNFTDEFEVIHDMPNGYEKPLFKNWFKGYTRSIQDGNNFATFAKKVEEGKAIYHGTVVRSQNGFKTIDLLSNDKDKMYAPDSTICHIFEVNGKRYALLPTSIDKKGKFFGKDWGIKWGTNAERTTKEVVEAYTEYARQSPNIEHELLAPVIETMWPEAHIVLARAEISNPNKIDIKLQDSKGALRLFYPKLGIKNAFSSLEEDKNPKNSSNKNLVKLFVDWVLSLFSKSKIEFTQKNTGLQEDKVSCGVYVAYTLDQIANGQDDAPGDLPKENLEKIVEDQMNDGNMHYRTLFKVDQNYDVENEISLVKESVVTNPNSFSFSGEKNTTFEETDLWKKNISFGNK